MKKRSEVCEIVGITRRALQGYAEIGLQKPSEITKSGYWLYDEAALQRLLFIQLFVEVGYDRKTIKKMLDSDELDLFDEFEKVISLLREKQKRITGMINTIENIKVATQLPIASLKAISRTSVSQLYGEKSFMDYLDESFESASLYSDVDKDEAAMYLTVWYLASAIGCLKNESPTSKEVQECVIELCKYFIKAFEEDEEDTDDEDMPEELVLYLMAKELSEGIGEMLTEPEVKKMLHLQCGEGAEGFIKLAMQGYCELNKYIEEKYEMED